MTSPAPELLTPIRGVQPSFDDLGTQLRDVTFCVVDLETTGNPPGEGGITEIGAVKVRAGEVIGEFQTLVNPSESIPPFIAVLTGITNLMVASSPRIESVLPAFLEFAQGCVMVAHNAPFDMGFLKHESQVHGYDWPDFAVVDTALLARRVITPDEAPNCKLGTLAKLFRATTTRRSGTWPKRCRMHRVCTCSPTTAARSCTSASRRTCAIESGRTSPHPRPAAGSAR